MRCFAGWLEEGCQKSRLEKTVGVGVGREEVCGRLVVLVCVRGSYQGCCSVLQSSEIGVYNCFVIGVCCKGF